MPKIIVLDDLSQDGLGSVGVGRESRSRSPHRPEGRRPAQGPAGSRRRDLPQRREDHRRVLEGNTRLRAIARAGVGVDNIDTQAATRQGIVVMNTPGGNTISTAEHTIALMLGMSRNIAAGLSEPGRGPLGPQEVHGHATGRQDAGHHRPGPHRPGRGHARPRPGNAGPRLRSVPARPPGPRNWASRPCESAREMLPAGRLSHGPHAAERRHART